MNYKKWQIVPTWAHGIEYYATAATLPPLPRLFGWSRKVTRLFDCVAATAAVQSLMTDYELGAVKVLPMQGHLTMDVLIGAGMVTAAAPMDDEPQSARLAAAGTGLYAIALAPITRPVPSHSAGPSLRAAGAVGRAAKAAARGNPAEAVRAVAAAAGGDGSR